jgi:predicted Rossmann-fold nucleotide-binding protein
MAQLSDAFLFLPGGFGTFEELGTYRMWGKLGECLFLSRIRL